MARVKSKGRKNARRWSKVSNNESTVLQDAVKRPPRGTSWKLVSAQLEVPVCKSEQAVATLSEKTQLDDASAKLTEAETQLAAQRRTCKWTGGSWKPARRN